MASQKNKAEGNSGNSPDKKASRTNNDTNDMDFIKDQLKLLMNKVDATASNMSNMPTKDDVKTMIAEGNQQIDNKINTIETDLTTLRQQVDDNKQKMEADMETFRSGLRTSPMPSSHRVRSAGAPVTDAEEEERARSAVISGFAPESFHLDIKQIVKDKFGDRLPDDIKLDTPGRLCSICFIIFESPEASSRFIKEHINKSKEAPVVHEGRKLYVNENKTPSERHRDKSIRKLTHVLLTLDPELNDKIIRKYHRGFVNFERTRVGDWIEAENRFVIHTAAINALSLKFSGDEVQKAWDEAMGH
jgi:hypothetical protein